jgi:hypothetical protein
MIKLDNLCILHSLMYNNSFQISHKTWIDLKNFKYLNFNKKIYKIITQKILVLQNEIIHGEISSKIKLIFMKNLIYNLAYNFQKKRKLLKEKIIFMLLKNQIIIY